MTESLATRLQQLENRTLKPVPWLIYCSPNRSYEEAKATYEQQHGFKLPTNARIIEFVVI